MVRKTDLEDFYKTNHKLLLEQQQPKHSFQQQQLFLPSLDQASHNQSEEPQQEQQHQQHHRINAQLELYHQEQQIALQSAPKVKIQDLADEENTRRREFYNSNNAKPLQLFRLPRKHEIQTILATSKGDLATVKQIVGKAYHDCFLAMNLIPKRFIQKTVLNPQDWAEIVDEDINIVYNPNRYKFFPTAAIMDDFFTWLDNAFSPETLDSFRASSLYQYNIGAQLQKGGGVLHHAAQHGDLDIIQFALRHGAKAHINQLTSNNSTPLHWACGAGWLTVVKELIDNGADIHLCTNSWGVDVFGRDSGQLPLQWAAASGHGHIVEYLYMLSPLTIGITDEKDNSVRHSAQKGLHFDTIRKIEKMVKDEYVPIQLEIHSMEQNMLFDHTQYHQFKKEKQQREKDDGDGDDADKSDRSDVVDIDMGESDVKSARSWVSCTTIVSLSTTDHNQIELVNINRPPLHLAFFALFLQWWLISRP